jgi:hypothetical protein
VSNPGTDFSFDFHLVGDTTLVHTNQSSSIQKASSKERNCKKGQLSEDRPIVFGLLIILRKYLTTGSLARAKFEAVSLDM